MNATNFLRQDHTQLRKLYNQLNTNTDTNKVRDLFDQLAVAIDVHTQIEEEIFYPEADRLPGLKDLVVEARKEHNTVKGLLRELRGMKGNDANFKPKLQKLWENLEHHVNAEEKEMFPKFETACAKDQHEQIGKKLEDRWNQARKKTMVTV